MNVMLSAKLKNGIEKENWGKMNLEYKLKNISVNGNKRGCSGFIHNMDNNKIIYITTEICCYSPLADKTMFRYAIDFKDYSGKGGCNQWVKTEILFSELVKALK